MTTKQKGTHTPKEWHEANTGNHQGLIIDGAGNNIAVAYDKVNARLIAAAPELLEALEQAIETLHEFGSEDVAYYQNIVNKALF